MTTTTAPSKPRSGAKPNPSRSAKKRPVRATALLSAGSLAELADLADDVDGLADEDWLDDARDAINARTVELSADQRAQVRSGEVIAFALSDREARALLVLLDEDRSVDDGLLAHLAKVMRTKLRS